MGYFPNGTAGDIYEDEHCASCVHRGKDGAGCNVMLAHVLYAYEECNSESNAKRILDLLIPPTKDGLGNERCTMWHEGDPPDLYRSGEWSPEWLQDICSERGATYDISTPFRYDWGGRRWDACTDNRTILLVKGSHFSRTERTPPLSDVLDAEPTTIEIARGPLFSDLLAWAAPKPGEFGLGVLPGFLFGRVAVDRRLLYRLLRTTPGCIMVTLRLGAELDPIRIWSNDGRWVAVLMPFRIDRTDERLTVGFPEASGG